MTAFLVYVALSAEFIALFVVSMVVNGVHAAIFTEATMVATLGGIAVYELRREL